MINEVWKDVVGYEGIYEVSNRGEVRTHKDKTTYTELRGIRNWKQRVLKQKVSKDNNHRVNLWKDGKGQTWLVHRLVAFAFIAEVAGKEYVNHIDGNRMNNAVDNLEWCNHKENNNHAFDTGLIQTGKKITLVNKITGEEHNFRSMTKASDFLNRDHGAISRKLKKGISEVDGFKIIAS